MRATVLAVLAACLPLAADGTKDDAKKELERLQGTWTMAALEIDGQPVPADKLRGTTLEIKGHKYIVTVKGEKHAMALALDPSQKPKAIDMTAADGPNKDKVHRGIYELEGDTLKLCRAREPDGERPTEFGTWPDTGVFLVTWKREKK